ncbi:RNA-guided endonuclease InsQ/TnpB family protein [Heyndrickxia sp. MSNUG]|uniref:RNA-guided endonuclease InsQ/TnpB family protein n=1 Tax=Heyndrickxia sp. MSNUG TaxID=3136677 RepID=UPI003C2B28A9
MPTLTIKIPLFEPTNVKKEMYETMRSNFSDACNQAIQLKKDDSKMKASEIDKQLGHFLLPSTLVQEARKLAVSRYQDWNKNKKTKGFPRFKKKISIPFNNQNWRLRFDNGFLKLGIPTLEEGNLTVDKYVPLKTNNYSLFWVNFLLHGEMDKKSKFFNKSYETISKPRKSNGHLFFKNGKWFFSFVISFVSQNEVLHSKAIGVDRGLKYIAVAGDSETGDYLHFDGKNIGHIRRKFSRLRRILMKNRNLKALKRLENKEQRIIQNWNHVISKQIVEFAQKCGASIIKIEDLSNIRSMKKFWKSADRNINSWAFFDLELKLTYKAQLAELVVQKVNPFKTSQECSKCGNTKKMNRRGSLYSCSCGYKKNADVNASFVISTRPSINENLTAA